MSLGVEKTTDDDDDCNKTRLFRLLIYDLIQSGLCTTVTLGKWQNDCYMKGDRDIQVNFVETIRQLKILGSCPVTVIYRATAIYRAVIYRFDYSKRVSLGSV